MYTTGGGLTKLLNRLPSAAWPILLALHEWRSVMHGPDHQADIRPAELSAPDGAPWRLSRIVRHAAADRLYSLPETPPGTAGTDHRHRQAIHQTDRVLRDVLAGAPRNASTLARLLERQLSARGDGPALTGC